MEFSNGQCAANGKSGSDHDLKRPTCGVKCVLLMGEELSLLPNLLLPFLKVPWPSGEISLGSRKEGGTREGSNV